MTPEEIERGFRELGLVDEVTRRTLQRLREIVPKSNITIYEAVTTAHTSEEKKGTVDAKLEPSS